MLNPNLKSNFKCVRGLNAIDVYRVLKLFEVTDPCLQAAITCLLAQEVTPAKVQEAIDSLQRLKEMAAEESDSETRSPDDYSNLVWRKRDALPPEDMLVAVRLRSSKVLRGPASEFAWALQDDVQYSHDILEWAALDSSKEPAGQDLATQPQVSLVQTPADPDGNPVLLRDKNLFPDEQVVTCGWQSNATGTMPVYYRVIVDVSVLSGGQKSGPASQFNWDNVTQDAGKIVSWRLSMRDDRCHDWQPNYGVEPLPGGSQVYYKRRDGVESIMGPSRVDQLRWEVTDVAYDVVEWVIYG